MILGIDIKFTINSKQFTVQVKPLISITEGDKEYIVNSSGNIKKYNVDYLAFANHRDNITILFRNRGSIIYQDNIIKIPKENIVEI